MLISSLAIDEYGQISGRLRNARKSRADDPADRNFDVVNQLHRRISNINDRSRSVKLPTLFKNKSDIVFANVSRPAADLSRATCKR